MKVVIIEDNAIDRKLMSSVLQASGYTTCELETAVNAVERIKAEKPDVIILDLALPNKDGLAAMGEFRSVEEIRGIPVLAVTAQPGRYTARLVSAAGFRSWLVKPIDVRELPLQVEQAVKG